MKFTDLLTLDITFEILKFIPIKHIINFLLILSKKEVFNFLENDFLLKSLLQNYLLDEINICKEKLNQLILDINFLQNIYKQNDYNNFNSNALLKKQNLKNILQNYNDNMIVKINFKLLQYFTEIYKTNYILPNLSNNCNEKFKIEQIIYNKWKIIFNEMFTKNPNELNQFKEIFIFEKEINEIKTENYLLQLFKEIKKKLNLNNFVYSFFFKYFCKIIEPIIISLLQNVKNNENNTALQKLMLFIKKHNLNIPKKEFLKWCYKIKFCNELKEFFTFCLKLIENELYLENNNCNVDEEENEDLFILNDYKEVTIIIKNLLIEENNFIITNEFYENLSFLMNLFITKYCDYNELFETFDFGFYQKIILNLLKSEKDTNNELYNFLNSLQIFKYNKKFSIKFCNPLLQCNFNNFYNLWKLNVITKESLLFIFNNGLINSFNLQIKKEYLLPQLKNYLNFFINELKFNIYGEDENNILSNIFKSNFNIFTIINIIKDCCNLQEINYSKIKFTRYTISSILTSQLLGSLFDDFLYENDQSLQSNIKLQSIKEIYKLPCQPNSDINHTHLFHLVYHLSTIPIKSCLLPSLQFILSNTKVDGVVVKGEGGQLSLSLEEYVEQQLLKDKDVLEKKLLLQKEKIERNATNVEFEKIFYPNSDFAIYYVYKNLKDAMNRKPLKLPTKLLKNKTF
ncbi:hypothetical protein ABK040_005395 [Willaertia magna]